MDGKISCVPARLELAQEPQIAARKQTDVVDAVAHHGQARQSQAEGEAAPLIRIDAAHPQHIRIHQAARQQFHPAALLADRAAGTAANQALDVQLETGFDERKVSRPKAHRDLAEEEDDSFAHGLRHRALEHIDGAHHIVEKLIVQASN